MSGTTIDATGLGLMILDLESALGTTGTPADLSELVRDEVRRASETIVRIMPPKTKAQGKSAATRDLFRLFSGVDPFFIDTIGSEHGLKDVDTWITKKDGGKIHIRWQRIDPTGAHMREIHRAAYKGREIPPVRQGQGEWKARNVVPNEEREAYAKKVEKRIGRAKAAWAKVAADLGGQSKIVSWVAEHLRGQNPKAVSEIAGLQDGRRPEIIFGSRAPGVSREEAKIRDAIRIRREALAKRIKLILSGYSRDVARGMRISAKAKRTQ